MNEKELREKVEKLLPSEMEEVSVSLPDGTSYITTTYDVAVDELVALIYSEVEREVKEAEKLWHKKRRLAKKRNQEIEANEKIKYQSMTSRSQWEQNAIGDSGNEAERLNDV